jgi:hypothetical protein
MDDAFQSIQHGINRRQEELDQSAKLLAERAKLNTWTASGAKVALIVLGALTATRASADVLLGASSAAATTLYTGLGILTAAIAGFTAAFDFERRASQLTQLAAEAWGTLRQVDSEWRRSIGVVPGSLNSEGAMKIMELQDAKLADIQGRAARLGINVALDIPELISSGEHGPYPA